MNAIKYSGLALAMAFVVVHALPAAAGHAVSAGIKMQGGTPVYEVSVGPGEGLQGVYALYGSHEPSATEMWEHVDYLGEVDEDGGTFTFSPDGDWSVIRFAAGRFYVRDGMLAFWDAIWNLRSGHGLCEYRERPWENLVSGQYDFTLKAGEAEWFLINPKSIGFQFKSGYALLSAEDTAATFGTVSATGGTMEVSLSVNQGTKDYTQTILRSSKTGNLAFHLDYRGATFTGDSPSAPLATYCKGSDLAGAATVSVAFGAGTKVPSAGFLNGDAISFSGAGNGVGASNFGEDVTVVGRLNSSTSEDEQSPYRGSIHAIRLYTRALTQAEAERNSAADKARFLDSTPAMTLMKEGAAESLSAIYPRATARSIEVAGNAFDVADGRRRYQSYTVNAAPGGMDAELWMFYGRTAPSDDLDFDGWEHCRKIADATTSGGVWTVPAPEDSAWRKDGYEIRFALIAKYVPKGLIGRYDGIRNTRAGHAAAPAAFENLMASDTDSDFTLNGVIGVTSNSLSFSGATGCCASLTAEKARRLIPFVEDQRVTVESAFRIRPGTNDNSNQAIFNCTGTWQGGSGTSALPYAICSMTNGLCLSTADSATCPAVTRESLYTLSSVSVDYYQRYNSFWQGIVRVNGSSATRDGPNRNTSGGNAVTIGNRLYGSTVAEQMPFCGEFHTLRIYTRRLEESEAAHNAAIDQARFGVPASAALSTAAGDTVVGVSGAWRVAADPSALVIAVK